MFMFIHRQYAATRVQVALRPDQVVAAPHRDERVVVPVNGLNRAVVQAVNVGRSMSDDVRAVLVDRATTSTPRSAGRRGSARCRACRSSSWRVHTAP